MIYDGITEFELGVITRDNTKVETCLGNGVVVFDSRWLDDRNSDYLIIGVKGKTYRLLKHQDNRYYFDHRYESTMVFLNLKNSKLSCKEIYPLFRMLPENRIKFVNNVYIYSLSTLIKLLKDFNNLVDNKISDDMINDIRRKYKKEDITISNDEYELMIKFKGVYHG